jgi:hypothetical protein
MSYIEVNLKLDSLDILMLESLIEARIEELEGLKAVPENAWFITRMADEQIDNHKHTLKRLNAAHDDVKRVKAEMDKRNADEYRASHPLLKTRRVQTRKK